MRPMWAYDRRLASEARHRRGGATDPWIAGASLSSVRGGRRIVVGLRAETQVAPSAGWCCVCARPFMSCGTTRAAVQPVTADADKHVHHLLPRHGAPSNPLTAGATGGGPPSPESGADGTIGNRGSRRVVDVKNHAPAPFPAVLAALPSTPA